MTINVFDAVRKATDPMGIDGEQVSAIPPSAKEVLARLGTLGFVVVAPLDIAEDIIREVEDTVTDSPRTPPDERTFDLPSGEWGALDEGDRAAVGEWENRR